MLPLEWQPGHITVRVVRRCIIIGCMYQPCAMPSPYQCGRFSLSPLSHSPATSFSLPLSFSLSLPNNDYCHLNGVRVISCICTPVHDYDQTGPPIHHLGIRRRISSLSYCFSLAIFNNDICHSNGTRGISVSICITLHVRALGYIISVYKGIRDGF